MARNNEYALMAGALAAAVIAGLGAPSLPRRTQRQYADELRAEAAKTAHIEQAAIDKRSRKAAKRLRDFNAQGEQK